HPRLRRQPHHRARLLLRRRRHRLGLLRPPRLRRRGLRPAVETPSPSWEGQRSSDRRSAAELACPMARETTARPRSRAFASNAKRPEPRSHVLPTTRRPRPCPAAPCSPLPPPSPLPVPATPPTPPPASCTRSSPIRAAR